MRIQILGGHGFIGTHLEGHLSATADLDVISLRAANWRDLIASDAGCMINLVGKAHDHHGVATQADYYFANLELAQQVFQAFVSSSAHLLIHISSLAALEEFESDHPLSEGDACHPISWYGHSKRAAEEWLLSQELPVGKKLIILRPPMVHGPGDKGNLGLLYKFVSKGIPYPLAAFDNRRSFISIDNFCYLIEQIILHSEKMTTGIYHIADDEPLSTRAIIDVISKVTGVRTRTLAIPSMLIRAIARVGDFVPIPLNSKRLKKMTANLLISNQLIKSKLAIDQMPETALEGLYKTIISFGSEVDNCK